MTFCKFRNILLLDVRRLQSLRPQAHIHVCTIARAFDPESRMQLVTSCFLEPVLTYVYFVVIYCERSQAVI